jgi:hypothetical protein
MADQDEEGRAVTELVDALEIAGMWYHDEDPGRLKTFITVCAQLANAETPIVIVLGALDRLDLRQYDKAPAKKSRPRWN